MAALVLFSAVRSCFAISLSGSLSPSVSLFALYSSGEQVHTLHIVGLHLMIVAARCQLSLDSDNDELFSDGMCDYENWFSPVITLYVCSFVRVSEHYSRTKKVTVECMYAALAFHPLHPPQKPVQHS